MKFTVRAILFFIKVRMGPMKITYAYLAVFGSVLASCGTATKPMSQEEVRVQIDTREVDEYETPHTEGASGILSYREGCLYLSANNVNTGLVVPSAFSFDGHVLRTEFGEVQISERTEFTGTFANPSTMSYACSEFFPNVLIVDYARPAKVKSSD